MKNKLLILLVLLIYVGCSQNEKRNDYKILVFNLIEKNERIKADFLKMNLDANHPNLLSPNISKNDLAMVYKSWTKLHSELNDFLNEKGFSWGVSSEKIKLFNKIYFNKNGKVKVYAFRIFDPISDETVIEYKKLVKLFFKDTKISINKKADFAQCGKISLPNKKIVS